VRIRNGRGVPDHELRHEIERLLCTGGKCGSPGLGRACSKINEREPTVSVVNHTCVFWGDPRSTEADIAVGPGTNGDGTFAKPWKHRF
jgi:hypothetical protein